MGIFSMKTKWLSCSSLVALLLALSSCDENKNTKNVISQRYIHKYGYDVSPEEWKTQQYPGQVLTTMRDGKTITESYEDGQLHGLRTETYPHSQTVKIMEQYERGRLNKRVVYSIRGVPETEELYKTDAHLLVTSWYPKGTPKSKEEYKDGVLINGWYYNAANETDTRIENGTGEKTVRNQNGDLLSKEIFNNYQINYIESYYPNNTPCTTVSYENGKINGQKKHFSMTGEPIFVEQYINGHKHGVCTYYQNGYKYLEVPYAFGVKNGVERHYIDGETVSEETEYQDGIKNGPSVVYCDGSARTTWYFENQKVSRSKYEQLVQRHEAIMTAQR